MRQIKLYISFILIILLLISYSLPCFAEETAYVWSNAANTDLSIETNAQARK